MDKPEALRLEDVPRIMDNANAELRRLHAECNDLAHQLNESNERNGRLKAQRDALLELVVEMDGHEGAEGWSEDLRVKINVAIKAVEEGK